MKYMAHILMLLIVFSSTILANKTDIYFGNGILTLEVDARENAKLLKVKIKKKLYNGNEFELKKDINKVRYAYIIPKAFGMM